MRDDEKGDAAEDHENERLERVHPRSASHTAVGNITQNDRTYE